jgi:hypothetical protein
MIKQEIIGYVKSFLPREDPTMRYHNRVVIAAIENVLREMYAELYRKNPHLLDLYTKRYGSTTPIAISYEATTDIYYSTLPCKIMNLPCKGSGVRHIYREIGTSREGNKFIPMTSTEADFIYNTDVAVVTDRIGYSVRQDTRVDYYGGKALYDAGVGVVMDLLVPFSEYGDDDVVMIPEITDLREDGGVFIKRVLGLLGVIPQANLQDTNAPQENEQTNKRQ